MLNAGRGLVSTGMGLTSQRLSTFEILNLCEAYGASKNVFEKIMTIEQVAYSRIRQREHAEAEAHRKQQEARSKVRTRR